MPTSNQWGMFLDDLPEDKRQDDRCCDSAENSLTSSLKSTSSSVHFGSITLRHYEITLGDNPSCEAGPPLTLDWNYYEEEEQPTVDAFEIIRQPDRRNSAFLKLRPSAKKSILLSKGITKAEIRSAMSEIRQQRRRAKGPSLWSYLKMVVKS